MGLEREDVVVKETVVMDTPDRNKNQISTPISKFEDSPVFNFLNNLSPIMPVKTVQLTQPLNSLSFASVPSVFTSPHVSSIKGSRFLRRHQLSDPSGPEFSSDDSVRVDADEGNSDAVNYSNVKEKFGPTTSELEASPVPSSECSKLTFELLRTVNYECSSPSILSSCVIRSACLSDFSGRSAVCAPLVQEISEKGVPSDEASMEGVSQIEKNEEASACDWESLISGATDILIFDSPSDPEAFTKERDPCFKPYDFVSSGMLNSKGGSGEEGGDGNDLENQSTQPGEEIELQECIESQSMVLDSSLTNNAIAEGPSKKVNEAISSLYSGMRRRCLVFEMVGARNKQTGENCGSSGSGSSSEQQAGGNPASDKKQLVPQKTVNESSRCILPGIGLHLNALAATSKDGKVIKHESNTSSKQLFIASRSAINSEPVTIVHESPNESPPLTSTKGAIVQLENSSETPGYMAKEDLNQSCKKRRKLEPDEGEACKRCNCKKSKCLKLYCECFAAGVYCVGTCSCQDCFNKPMHEDTVLATRTLIESRNPLAFAPKVIKSCDSLSQTWDDSSKTPASARHKRGCNCKRSGCLKKYCECYQGGVGCSIGCRCEGCKNTFGRKDGTDCYLEEEETNICKKSIVDTLSQKSLVQSEIEKNLDSAHPATPLKFGRLPMQLPFSLKNKPPRSSLLSIGSSSGKDAGLGISRPNFIPSQPIFNKRGDSNQEDEIPEVLQGTGSPTSTIKSASPNSKRVSPPHYNTGISPGPRRSRKLILKSIPSFPSLTPNP